MKIRFNRTMKLILLTTAAILFAFSFDFGQKSAHAYRGGPDPSRTGAPAIGTKPAELTCNSTGCHSGNPLNDAQGTFQILDVPASYTPNQVYTIRVSLSRTGNSRFGFQLVALDQDGNNAGTLATDDNSTQLIAADPGAYAGRNYIEHTSTGTNQTSAGQRIWTIRWTAPATRGGKITFYAAGNAANNNSGASGDFIYTTSAVMRPEAVTVNGASFSTTASLTANGISSAFGSDLATTTETATDADPNTPGIQLPTTLGGTTVKVRDSANMERDAGIFYVQPTQVNYLVPAGTANGTATVTIRGSDGATSTGTITVATVAPGIFTAASSGSGVIAADVQRVDGGQTTGFTRVFSGTNAVPIVWNNATEQLFLNLYCTGARGFSSLSNISVMIGGAAQTVSGAAAQSQFAGLDQINVLLNRNLAGRGNVDLVLTVDGQVANTVTLNFQ
jgi:uncharacterized protein (TIGR03437 family)